MVITRTLSHSPLYSKNNIMAIRKLSAWMLLSVGILSIMFTGCSTEKTPAGPPHFVIAENDTSIEVTSLFNHATVIPLSDKELMGPLLHVEKYKDYLYALDNKRQTMAKYDMDGNQVSFMRRVGHGYGEYTSISDFDIHDDSIYILCGNRILVADTDFKILDVIDMGEFAWRIAATDDGIYLYCGNMRTLYRFADGKLETLREDGQLLAMPKPFYNRVFYKTDKGLLFAPYATGEVYRIDGRELHTVFSFTSPGYDKAMEKFESSTQLELLDKLKYSVPVIYNIFKNNGFYYVLYNNPIVYRILKLTEDMEFVADGFLSGNLINNSLENGAMSYSFVEDGNSPLEFIEGEEGTAHSSKLSIITVEKDNLPADYPAIIIFE